MTQDILRDFALDATSMSVLASMQAELVREDIRFTPKDTSRKQDSYGKWLKLVETGFDQMEAEAKPQV